jgi:exodeoxyribonuclease V gamma subunit
VRHGRLRAKDRLRLWIDHLVLQCTALDGVERRSTLVALDGSIGFGPTENPRALLDDLLLLFREGMCAPLPFYPETAWAWVEQKAGWRAIWEGSSFNSSFNNRPGERDDPYVQLALRDVTEDPLAAEFQSLAGRILSPLRAALLKVGDG